MPGKQMLAIEMKKGGLRNCNDWQAVSQSRAQGLRLLLRPSRTRKISRTFLSNTGRKTWGKNLIEFPEKHSTDAITDLTLDWLKNRKDEKNLFLMHHYKAPHDYFENADRYESYLADIDIPEPEPYGT